MADGKREVHRLRNDQKARVTLMADRNGILLVFRHRAISSLTGREIILMAGIILVG
jgi:hypothetical protein